MKNITTNTLTTVLLIAVLLTLVEGVLFDNGMTFFALVGVISVYISFRKQKKQLLWFGIIFLLIALLSMWSLQLLLVGTLVYILWKIKDGTPIKINVDMYQRDQKDSFVSKKNKVLLFEDTIAESYVWQDVHLQNFAGEVSIDTTSTILPKGTSFISIRQGIGKISIQVPYEIPIRVHFNTMIGEANIMNQTYPRLWNEAIAIKDGYSNDQTVERELVIIASSFFGDLEVIRK